MVALPIVRNEAALVQVSATALVLIYVLAPEIRDQWDVNPHPGCFAPMHTLARALVDLREEGSTERLVALGPSERQVMRATMPIPWLTELAVGMVVARKADGRELLEELGNLARPTLRRQLDSPHELVAAAAKDLLSEMPSVPMYRLQLRVLGPLTLLRDGVAERPDELRRERVRQLLGYLIIHRRTPGKPSRRSSGPTSTSVRARVTFG